MFRALRVSDEREGYRRDAGEVIGSAGSGYISGKDRSSIPIWRE